MKYFGFNRIIIIILVVLSFVFFSLQQFLFSNINETGFLFFQYLMFLPLNILFVTFILNKILQSREKQEKLDQINIVIGAFFSDVGTNTLEKAAGAIKAYPLNANANAAALEKLKEVLPQRKSYLLQMFSNPNLLEHNTFTDMLWALYHLIDELENRTDISSLPETDIAHLLGDLVRSYCLLVYEWIFYMKYLKKRYPYLWSLAVRKNPFADNKIIIM